jgi:predicted HAD superfamily phosphohydrolase YqeG
MEGIKWLLFDWGDTLMFDNPDFKGEMYLWPDIKLMPGVIETLPKLAHKYHCAVVSNAVDSNAVTMKKAFERMDIAHYFELFITSKEIGYKKPDERFFTHIVDLLGIPANEICMVGNDYEKDIIAPRILGIQTVLITSDKNAYPLADHVIDRFDNILDILLLNANNQNPWRQLPHDIYEKHMGHEEVKQLEMLSRIFNDQLALVSDIQNPIIAILGITGGNGLDYIEAGRYKSVIGIDINEKYLDTCRQRYGHLPELDLMQIDLMAEKARTVEILKQADLVTANLLVKHIHLNNFIKIVNGFSKPIISVTIQYNPDGQSLSNSGFEAEFENIQKHGKNHNETDLSSAMIEIGYNVFNRMEYELPNKKVFIRLDYKRQEGFLWTEKYITQMGL